MVSERFEDETVIVTGSTRGIGKRVAKRFASEGAAVVVTGRTTEAGEAVVDEIEATGGVAEFVRADMREPDDIAALVEATAEYYGDINVLVNNAGVQTDTAVDEASREDWAFVVETDFRAYWLAAKYAREYMPPHSSIVNVSSNHAYLTMPEMFPYNAVKAGINGMTRAMALDFGPEIRANTVTPGWIEIDRTREEIPDDEFEHVESIHPVGRIGQPADVAGPVTFLASDDAAFVTGASLLVDGGRTAVMQDDTLPDYRQRREEMDEN
jgi:NAD(P)-dependent dehydrogenase (short-subunit alcohol dehydrogenase family)